MRSYRHKETGVEAFRYGTHILVPKVDSPDVSVPFKDDEWVATHETPPLSKHQVGHLTYENDRLLSKFLLGEMPKPWTSLTDKQKQRWVRVGPTTPEIRRGAWLSLTEALSQKVD